jgi:hypothetical protein
MQLGYCAQASSLFYLSLSLLKIYLTASCCLKPFFFPEQGDRTKNVGVVDAEYIVHYGRPTLGGIDRNEV